MDRQNEIGNKRNERNPDAEILAPAYGYRSTYEGRFI
jgi:hypothetical protein